MSFRTLKVGYYPGTFNPWHEGHEDVLKKALLVFDKVIVAVGVNPDKAPFTLAVSPHVSPEELQETLQAKLGEGVCVESFVGLMVDHIKLISRPDWRITGVIRGLRNGYDLQYEMNQQYWNEDLGLTVPIVFFITDRKLAHISSSSIRAIGRARETAAAARRERISYMKGGE
jgi:pantetheine-phosphate adenylyltransferase